MIGESYTGQILFTESLVNLTTARRTMLMDRESLADDSVSTTVAGIIRHVRSEGDRALIAMARDFDGAELEALEVPRTAWRTAVDSLDRGLLSAMERTIRNIESVQRAFLRLESTSHRSRVSWYPDELTRWIELGFTHQAGGRHTRAVFSWALSRQE